MDGLTINEAAETTGWTPRMLRYLESVGLVEPPRTRAGYRLFGPAELKQLRTLRALLDSFGCALSDMAFANRMRTDAPLKRAVDAWFDESRRRPEGVAADDWLRWEQEKHQR